MRITRIVAQLVILLGLASLGQIPHESAYAATASQDVAVSPQYDTAHVYVAPEEFDRFVASRACGRRRCPGQSVRRSGRTGRDRSVAWRCKHATVLAYNSAVLSWAPDYSRESRLRFG